MRRMPMWADFCRTINYFLEITLCSTAGRSWSLLGVSKAFLLIPCALEREISRYPIHWLCYRREWVSYTSFSILRCRIMATVLFVAILLRRACVVWENCPKIYIPVSVVAIVSRLTAVWPCWAKWSLAVLPDNRLLHVLFPYGRIKWANPRALLNSFLLTLSVTLSF